MIDLTDTCDRTRGVLAQIDDDHLHRPTPADAPAFEQVLALAGRDPRWGES